MSEKNTTFWILLLLARKIPKALVRAAALATGMLSRLKTGGPGAAWAFFRYYINNLTVSFCNCYCNTGRVECPCCGWRGYDFIPMDGAGFWVPRMTCPQCLGHDRHRAFHLYVTKSDTLLLRSGGTILHLAPETYVSDIVEKNPDINYVVADLDPAKLNGDKGRAFQADLLCMPLPDDSVDLIVCLHVLEHIADDRAAAQELHRFMKPGSTAYIMVPLNFSLEKSLFFGRPHPDLFDHYWAPGRDYQSHLDSFDSVRAVAPTDYLTPAEAFRYGAPPKEIVFVCRKNG